MGGNKEAGMQQLKKFDKGRQMKGGPQMEWETSGMERKKGGEEKRKGRRRVNVSCFLIRPIFNQHCLCSPNNHRKLARLDTHWVWMALLILAPRVSPAVPTQPMISWEVFPLVNEREKRDRERRPLFCFSWQDIPSVCLCLGLIFMSDYDSEFTGCVHNLPSSFSHNHLRFSPLLIKSALSLNSSASPFSSFISASYSLSSDLAAVQ